MEMFDYTNVLLDMNKEESYCTDMVQSESIELLCPICNSQHTNETKFYNHLHVHTEEVQCTMPELKEKIHENLNKCTVRPFKCQQCDLTFDRASQLDYHHRSIHLGEKSQLCEICGKGFFRKTDLRTHLNIHLRTNVCICEVCGRKFNHISNLIRHCRMHEGVKPYPCSVCGKRFTQISSLARHKRIHERSKDRAQLQSSSNYVNTDLQTADHRTSKDESIIGNVSNHRKVIKRQHYCKVCGESFSFVFLLRQHEKLHAENTVCLKCKNCEKSFQEIEELKKHFCHGNHFNKVQDKDKVINESDKNQDFCESESDVAKNVLPLDTIIYITSEQFKKINLEHTEERAIEMGKMIEMPGTLSDKTAELNISEIPITSNCNNIDSDNDSHLILYKSNDLKKKSNVIYIHQLDKTNIAFLEKHRFTEIELNGKSLDKCKQKSEGRGISTEISMYTYKSGDVLAEEKVACKSLDEETVFINRAHTKSLNIHDDSLCVQTCESLTKKVSETKNNVAMKIPENINDLFQKTDLSLDSNANVQAKTDFICKNNSELSSSQVERHPESSIQVNNIGNREEPMLRLVQTETGQQFYEFIISNLAEKLPNVHQSSKMSENKHDEVTNGSENICAASASICGTSENAKGISNGQAEREQDLRDINDIQNDLNYAQYGLQEEDKNFATNQTLLENDPQVDFDRYVEANFEVFERLTYENSSERFFEFVEIADGTPEISTFKEPPMVRFVQNEGEQFFEVLQDSQNLNKNESQDFLEIPHSQPNANISDNKRTEQMLLSCLKQDAECEVSTKKNCMVSPENQMENEGGEKNIYKGESVTQETKKAKIFVIKFQCTVCEKSFSNGYNYKQHIGTHFADQQKFHCKECKMSFAWKSTLNKHIANNHRPDGPQKFGCDVCSRVYNTLSQVNEHVKRDHLKQRNHICSHCGKSFFKKYDLKIHNRIHTDERPYVCRACGKRFHHRSHIIRHERIHF